MRSKAVRAVWTNLVWRKFPCSFMESLMSFFCTTLVQCVCVCVCVCSVESHIETLLRFCFVFCVCSFNFFASQVESLTSLFYTVARQVETFISGFVYCCKTNWDFHERVCVLLQGKLRLSWVGLCIVARQIETVMSGFLYHCEPCQDFNEWVLCIIANWDFDDWVSASLQAKLSLWQVGLCTVAS